MEYKELTKLMASKRIEAGVSIVQIAQHLNCDVEDIEGMEAGEVDVSMEVLLQYIKHLNLQLVFVNPWEDRLLYFDNGEQYRKFYLREYRSDILKFKMNPTYEDLHPTLNGMGQMWLMDGVGFKETRLLPPAEVEAMVHKRWERVYGPIKKCKLKPEPPAPVFILATFVSIFAIFLGGFEWIKFMIWFGHNCAPDDSFFLGVVYLFFFFGGITVGTLIVLKILFDLGFVGTCALFGYGPGTRNNFLIRFDWGNIRNHS